MMNVLRGKGKRFPPNPQGRKIGKYPKKNNNDAVLRIHSPLELGGNLILQTFRHLRKFLF
jgi:hypothetical protein